MGALLTSVLIEQQVGIETVTHYACRDRNLLGMLSDLLGASAVGLRNLLVITGDPPKMGPYPDATAVFDVDSIGLTNLVSNLNHGLDPGGNAIGQPTRFAIGVGVNPVAIDLEHELTSLRVEGRRGRRVRDHAAGVRRGAAREVPRRASAARTFRSSRASGRSCRCATPSFSRTRCRACRCRTRSSRGCGARTRSRRSTRWPRGSRSRARCSSACRPLVQGVQVSAPFGKVELALRVFE